MLFGIDKWPSGDVIEQDKARLERDKITNDHKSRMHSKIKESASYLGHVSVFFNILKSGT